MSYNGKITTTGSSEAIRLDKNLFKQNPEFKQQSKVKADIIAPGIMLLSVVDNSNIDNEEDPIMGAFLAFLETDMAKNPDKIAAVDANQIARAKALTAGVKVTDAELE